MKKRKETKIKCECPEKGIVSPEREFMYSRKEKVGMNHEPNKFKGTNNIKLYKRENEKLYLCSCCNLNRDVETNL